MQTIEERAKNRYSNDSYAEAVYKTEVECYAQGATDQHKIDVEKACEYIRSTYTHYDNPVEVEYAVELFKQAMEK